MAGPNMMPNAGGGADIAQQLMQLVQPILNSPKGQAMAQAVLSQMGGGNAGAAPMGNANPTGGLATDMDYATFEGENESMRPEAPRAPMDNYATGEVGPRPDNMRVPNTGGMSTEQELEMARQMMGGGGGMNEGNQPTPEEIELLKSSPTERNVRNFMKLFGEQAAMEALGTKYQGMERDTYEDNQGHAGRDWEEYDNQGHMDDD